MKKLVIFMLLAIALLGCMSVEVPVVEPWEGRYATIEEFKAATGDVQLKEGQQIWVLSNGTMYRLLKKVEK